MNRWLGIACGAVVGLAFVGVGLSRCGRSQVQIQALQPLPQDRLIQVYMNQNQAASFTEPYRPQTRPGDDLETIIVNQIQAARSTVDVAVQELRSPRIAQALRDRHRAGIQVRLILENTYSQPISSFSAAAVAQMDQRQKDRYQDNFQLIDDDGNGRLSAAEIDQYDALQIIRKAGIPWIDDTADGSLGSGLMHHKFVIIDGQTSLLTSANFTLSDLLGDLDTPDSRGNANSLVAIAHAPLAQLFSAEFNILWGDGPGKTADSRFGVKKPFRPAQALQIGKAQVWVQFSPSSAQVPWAETTNGLIAQMLATADQSIDLALFVFSEQQLANQLLASQRQNVQIRALVDANFAYQSYSELLDLLGVALSARKGQTLTCQVEPLNQVWSQPLATVGIPKLAPGDLLHHKFGVMDNQRVIMGSHNWSAAANQLNDETLVVIDHPLVAAHYQREFERLYTNSSLGLPKFLQQRVQQDQQRCGSLGSGPSSTAASPALTAAALINLNTASQEQLESLPGVGPRLAMGIIQHRPFGSLADLDRVPGVGPQLLQRLRSRVTW